MKKLSMLSMLALIALIALPLSAGEEPPADPEDSNLLFTLTIADVETGGSATRRSARVLSLAGTRSNLSTGWKVSIPTATVKAGGASDTARPVTSFSYHDVGLSASLEGQIVGKRRVLVRGRIEVSAVVPLGPAVPGEPVAPKVANFTHNFNVLLGDRADAVLAEVPRPEGGSMTLTLSAAIQD